jgi:WD40 repeat protein
MLYWQRREKTNEAICPAPTVDLPPDRPAPGLQRPAGRNPPPPVGRTPRSSSPLPSRTPTPQPSPTPTPWLTVGSAPVISVENCASLVEVQRLTEHDTDIVGALAFSPDGSILATGGNGQNVRLWNPRTGELLAVLQGHADNVNALVFTPDGATLASASSDHTIRLWDVSTQASLAVLQGHTDFITGLAISPDGRWLASGSQDQQVILWDRQAGTPHQALTGSAPVSSVVFSPDGSELAVSFWGATPDVLFYSVPDLSQAGALDVPGEGEIVRAVAYHPSGDFLAVATVNQLDPTVQVFDLEGRARAQSMRGHDLELNSVAYSPDGSLIASSSADTKIIIWDSQTGQRLTTLRHDANGNAAIFSPDGTLLATAGSDRSVRIWAVPTGANAGSLPSSGPMATPGCDGGFSRLQVGDYVIVVDAAAPQPIRSEPRAVEDTVLGMLSPGTFGQIIDGPVCADGLIFWKVENDPLPAGSGWMAEGDGTEYWLQLLTP